MKPHLTAITIGVDDLERSLVFYRDGLGLPTRGVFGSEFEHGAVAFFEMQSGLILAIWDRSNLAWDSGLPRTGRSPTEFSLGYNVNNRGQVDATLEEARKAGAQITKAAQDTFWGGYAGYFQDPDGHLWEVLWNPEISVPE